MYPRFATVTPMAKSRKVEDVEQQLAELAGVQFDVEWPAPRTNDPRVKVTATHPDRPFQVEMEFVQGDVPADVTKETGWVLVAYGITPRVVPQRDTPPSELEEVTFKLAEHYADALPMYRDMAAFQLDFNPRSQVEEAQALHRRGRRGLPDRFFEAIASEYRRHLAEGTPPTARIARDFDVGRSTAAAWVAGARSRGHLGPARGGQAGEAPQTDVEAAEAQGDE
jgi:transposase-like protein